MTTSIIASLLPFVAIDDHVNPLFLSSHFYLFIYFILFFFFVVSAVSSLHLNTLKKVFCLIINITRVTAILINAAKNFC